MYNALHLHSIYSLLDGISTSEDYCKKAASLGHKSMALTDHGRLSGLMDHHEACHKYGIKPIFGMEGYVVDELVSIGESGTRVRKHSPHIILLAKNKNGYKNLLKLNYLSNVDTDHYYYMSRFSTQELFENSKDIFCGTACIGSPFGSTLRHKGREEAEKLFVKYLDVFKDNFYGEVQLNELTNRIDLLEFGQKSYNDFIVDMCKKYSVPVVITGDVHYVEPGMSEIQTIGIAIRNSEKMNTLSFELEGKSLYYHDEKDFLSFNKEFGYNYKEEQIKEWVENTNLIADKCDFDYKERVKVYLPKVYEDDEEEIVKRSVEGLKKRMNGEVPKVYMERLKMELEVFIRKGFCSYVMILEDLVRFLEKDPKNTIGVGRGSATGSLVLYALGITHLDPIKYKLYFERFLSQSRAPDMVIDYWDEENS